MQLRRTLFLPLTLAALLCLFFWGGNAFSDSIGGAVFKTKCLGACHNKADIAPEKMTAKQWNSLIGEDEHGILQDTGLSDDERKEVTLFLMNNSSDSKRRAEGIGVWD